MSTRSVRLDSEAEKALSDIVNRTGLSISAAIKQGLLEYRHKTMTTCGKQPQDFFKDYDLGPGGYSIAPARNAKQAIKKKLITKHLQRAK